MGKPRDEADRLREDSERLQAEEVAKQKRRSLVLQRGLPRPTSVNPALSQENGPAILPLSQDENAIVSTVIGSELIQLIAHDNYMHPVATKSKKGSKRAPSHQIPAELENIDDEYLSAARKLVDEETLSLMEDAKSKFGSVITSDEYGNAWDQQVKQLVFVPSNQGGCYRRVEDVSKSELLSSLEQQYQALKAKIDKDGKKCTKLEQKIGIKTQGYMNIAEKAESTLHHSLQELDNRTIELGTLDC